MFLVLLLFYLPTLVNPQLNLGVSTNYIKPTKLECSFNPNWFVNASCKLKPISWEKSVVNARVDIAQPMRNLVGRMQVFRQETNFVPFLINITVNVCDLLNNKGIQFYTRIVLGLLKRFATMEFVTCPMHGHIEVREAYLDAKYMKNIMPKGLYRIKLSGMEQSETIVSVIVHAFVGEHIKKLNKSGVL